MKAPKWGDPLRCTYPWIEPHLLGAHAADLQQLSSRLAQARASFSAAAGLSPTDFSGQSADQLRARAEQRVEDAGRSRGNLRGTAAALIDHERVLRRYQAALDELHDLGRMSGLEVREEHVWAPTERVPTSDPDKYAAWLARWRSYRRCFDLKTEIEQERREQTQHLVQAMEDFAGAQPEPPQAPDGTTERVGEDREPRRAAATRALAVLQAQEELDEARSVVERLRAEHATAFAELDRLTLTNAPEEARDAQAAVVRRAAEALRESRSCADDLEVRLRDALNQV